MANNADGWKKQAEEAINDYRETKNGRIVPFAISMVAAIYGPDSPQLSALNATLERTGKDKDLGMGGNLFQQGLAALNVIENTIKEIDHGLIAKLRTQIAGEILSDLLTLAKESLEDQSDSAKNIAAVLAAAAYEDLIRRMGRDFAVVNDRPNLATVVTALKDSGVLQGGAVGVAQSYLKFRNDALYADWNKIDRPLIQSVISFTEGLLLKHFS
jgi:hypothetical protein